MVAEGLALFRPRTEEAAPRWELRKKKAVNSRNNLAI